MQRTKIVQMRENVPFFFQKQNAKNSSEITVNPLSLFSQEGKESKPDILNTEKGGKPYTEIHFLRKKITTIVMNIPS